MDAHSHASVLPVTSQPLLYEKKKMNPFVREAPEVGASEIIASNKTQ